MSAPGHRDDGVPVSAPGDGTTAASRTRTRWHRWRWPLAVGGAVLLIAVLTALTTPGGTRAPVDPENPRKGGSRAVAQVLRQQGVTVRKVTSTDQATVAARPGTTLVLVTPDVLGPDLLNRLSATGADLVAVEPGPETLRHLAPWATATAPTTRRTLAPRCDLPAARAAGAIRGGGLQYEVAPGTEATVCYPGKDATAGVYVVAERQGRRVVLLGQKDVLLNEHVTQEGNAALALHTLGTRPEVVWLVPDPLLIDVPGSRSALDLLPRSVRWITLPLLLAVVTALLWRARRLGRLVPEPLPVVVRSVEVHEGRARLYRRARARGRAAAILRTAALKRVAARLGLTAETTPAQVAALVASLTDRSEDEVHRTLLGPAPVDDHALVRLADDLDTLESALNHPAASDPATSREAHP